MKANLKFASNKKGAGITRFAVINKVKIYQTQRDHYDMKYISAVSLVKIYHCKVKEVSIVAD